MKAIAESERKWPARMLALTRGYRVRKYVRPNEVDETRAACDAHRALQAHLLGYQD